MGFNTDATRKTEQAPECAVPPANLFALPAEKIAETLASKEVSPQGAASGMRLLSFYINYAGKRLSAPRLRTLEKARKLLFDRVNRESREREARDREARERAAREREERQHEAQEHQRVA